MIDIASFVMPISVYKGHVSFPSKKRKFLEKDVTCKDDGQVKDFTEPLKEPYTIVMPL